MRPVTVSIVYADQFVRQRLVDLVQIALLEIINPNAFVNLVPKAILTTSVLVLYLQNVLKMQTVLQRLVVLTENVKIHVQYQQYVR